MLVLLAVKPSFLEMEKEYSLKKHYLPFDAAKRQILTGQKEKQSSVFFQQARGWEDDKT